MSERPDWDNQFAETEDERNERLAARRKTRMADTMSAPFAEGDIVTIKNNEHLGAHRVDSCEWFTDCATPYWLCHCVEIREPIDWSKIPEGATGIVTGSYWAGCSDHLVRS
jgi:hypothetical protein